MRVELHCAITTWVIVSRRANASCFGLVVNEHFIFLSVHSLVDSSWKSEVRSVTSTSKVCTVQDATQFVLAVDNDEAGRRCCDQLMTQLGNVWECEMGIDRWEGCKCSCREYGRRC